MDNYAELIADMGDDEAFEFVTHSMGAAFAEGAAEYLKSRGRLVSQIWHFNGYGGKNVNVNTNHPQWGPHRSISTFVVDYKNASDPLTTLEDIGGDDVLHIRQPGTRRNISTMHREPIDSRKVWDQAAKLISDVIRLNPGLRVIYE